MNLAQKQPTMNTIEEALQDIRAGKVIIVVDDEDRENEGDFVCAAEVVTPEIINFMARYGRGLICAPLDEQRADELGLELMVNRNTALHETAFTVSIDLIGHGCTTGISAYDRATGIRGLTDPTIRGEDYARPGHIFPLRAKTGGVLRRTGHTEAAVDLARLAGFSPAGVLVEILNEDGTMARVPELLHMAASFGLKIITIRDLVAYRLEREQLIQKTKEVLLPSPIGNLTFTAYTQITSGDQHLAVAYGSWHEDEIVPVRVQSAISFPELRQIMNPRQADHFNHILKLFHQHGSGLLVIMHHQDKAMQLDSMLHELAHHERMPSRAMDQRDFGVGAQIIRDQGVRLLSLISDSPIKRVGLEGYGLEMVANIPLSEEEA
jgi:3,4-dihydroxy 2-butanone 4-phosphate synthase/GTP cyclohydrolase II